MRRNLVVASMALVVGVLGPQAGALAEPCSSPLSEGPQQGPTDRRVYDPDTVTTLKGSVEAVSVVPAKGGRSGGTHVTLKSDGALTEVHIGPTWFLEQEGLKLEKGNSLEVTGSLLESEGKRFLVAREVKKGATSFRLRDQQGVPAWAGGPRRD